MDEKRVECLYVGGPWSGRRYRVPVSPTVTILLDGTEYVRSGIKGVYEDGRPFVVYCVKGQEATALACLVTGYRNKRQAKPDKDEKTSS